MIARLERPISIRRLSAEEHVHVEATEAERAALAQALDLLAIGSLTADVTLKAWRDVGVKVAGTVRGTVTQACIVTLEPVDSTVEESFERRMHPDVVESAEVELEIDAPDAPERLDAETVDVGAIVVEHFALGIDPYPRAPGAEFEPEPDEPEPSPFAVLAGLKNKMD